MWGGGCPPPLPSQPHSGLGAGWGGRFGYGGALLELGGVAGLLLVEIALLGVPRDDVQVVQVGVFVHLAMGGEDKRGVLRGFLGGVKGFGGV